MLKKAKLQLLAVVMCVTGVGILLLASPISVIEAFLLSFLQIHGIALFAKIKGRSLFWGLLGIHPILGSLIGLVLLASLKERSLSNLSVPINFGFWALGITIIVGGLISSLGMEQRSLSYDNPDYHPATLFASIAIFGYGFYLGGLDKFLTPKRLGIE